MIFSELYSPQTSLLLTPDKIIFQSGPGSKLMVFLILVCLPIVLFNVNAPAIYGYASLAYAIFAGVTYSKRFVLDKTTRTLNVRTVKFGIRREYEIPFDEIDAVQSVSYLFRRGTDLTIKLKSGKRIVVDTTECEKYINQSIETVGKFLPTKTVSRFLW